MATTNMNTNVTMDLVLISPSLMPRSPKLAKERFKPFLIGKYPVTNEQYSCFMHAGGYKTRECWSKEGWDFIQGGCKKINDSKSRCKKTGRITEPEDRDWFAHARYYSLRAMCGHPFQAMGGITYYEAEAFCNFIGGRLPSNEEWMTAALGFDGRKYPWGNAARSSKCVCYESTLRDQKRIIDFDRRKKSAYEEFLKRYFSIYAFPEDVSPFGCRHMAGYVSEWIAETREVTDPVWVWSGGPLEAGTKGVEWEERFSQVRRSIHGIEYIPAARANCGLGFRCVFDMDSR